MMQPEKARRIKDYRSSRLLFIPEEAQERVSQIALELAGHYEVETELEIFALYELAVARDRLAELDRQWHTLVDHEKRQACLTYDRLQNRQFAAELRQLRNHPAEFAQTLGQSWQGANRFAQTWHAVAEQLTEEPPGPGLDLFCEALLAQGLADRVQQMSEQGWWFMSRFLALHPEPERAIKAWVRKSRSNDPAVDEQRAAKRWADAPDAATAREQLQKRAEELAQFWSARARSLKISHDSGRTAFAEAIGGPAVNDRRLASARKIMQGFQKHAAGRILDLEKRLERAIANRLKAERQQHKEEARHQRELRRTTSKTKPTPSIARREMVATGKPVQSATAAPADIHDVIARNPILQESSQALQRASHIAKRESRAARTTSTSAQPARLLSTPTTSMTAP